MCLLIVAIAMMSRLGLTWHHYSLGIAAGFGVYSALDLILLELRAHLHVVTDAAFVLLRPAAYNLGVLIWAFISSGPRAGIRSTVCLAPTWRIGTTHEVSTLTNGIDDNNSVGQRFVFVSSLDDSSPWRPPNH